MPKYTFPLQTALDLRRREEERAQVRFAAAQRIVRDRRADLQRTATRHDAILSMVRGSSGAAGATVALGEIEHTSHVLADLRRRLANQRQRLEQAEHECELRRAELLEASRVCRTLERLSDRRRAEHMREEQRREERELNEAAITRHRAGSSTGLLTSLTRDLDRVA